MAVQGSAFGVGLGEFECALICASGFVDSSGTAQELGSGGVQAAVVIEVKAVEYCQAGSWSVEFGDGHGPVEFDDE